MSKKRAMVVPCFNEAHRFPKQYWKELVCSNLETQWFFVNDGSTDTTCLILDEIVKGTSAEVIQNKKNLGKGNSIREGFMYALSQSSQYKTLGYMDSDGAFSKLDLMRLIDRTSELDLTNHTPDAILSSRVALAGHNINRKPSRHYIGRLIATYLTRDWVGAPYDTQSGLKMFSNSTSFQNSLKEPFQTSWFVDIEIMSRIGIENGGKLSLWEEPLTSWSDISGSKLNFKQAPKLLWEMLIARREVSRLVKSRRSSDGSH
jgi:glycosyltransferase involved in cell wall biosynthesis